MGNLSKSKTLSKIQVQFTLLLSIILSIITLVSCNFVNTKSWLDGYRYYGFVAAQSEGFKCRPKFIGTSFLAAAFLFLTIVLNIQNMWLLCYPLNAVAMRELRSRIRTMVLSNFLLVILVFILMFAGTCQDKNCKIGIGSILLIIVEVLYFLAWIMLRRHTVAEIEQLQYLPATKLFK